MNHLEEISKSSSEEWRSKLTLAPELELKLKRAALKLKLEWPKSKWTESEWSKSFCVNRFRFFTGLFLAAKTYHLQYKLRCWIVVIPN
jgi:hypothetical protein